MGKYSDSKDDRGPDIRGPSLRMRFALFGAAVAVLTATALGGDLVLTAYDGLRTQAQQDQLVLARSLAARVDQALSQAGEAVAALSERRQVLGMNEPGMRRDLVLVAKHVALLDQLAVLDRNGKVLAHTWPWRPAILPPSSYFLRGISASPAQGSATFLSDIYRTPDGEVALFIRAPLRRDGRLAGVVAGVLQLPRHDIGNLENVHIGPTGHAYLVDQTGTPLLRARGPHVLEDRQDHALLADHLSGPEGVFQFKATDGRQILVAWSRVPASGWTVVVRQSASQTYEAAGRMLRSMCLIIALASPLAVLAAFLAAHWMAQPVESLIFEVRALESKAEDPDIETGAGGDTVDRLRKALRAMDLRLQHRRRQRDEAHRRAMAAERGLAESARLAALGELAAGLAHELNNPLTVIQGAAQVLPDSPPKEARHWSAEILREAARCKRLVGDLLDLARPVELKQETLSLRGLVQEAWQHALLQTRSRAVLRLPRGDLIIQADPLRLKQILGNLMRNALELGPKKGPLELTWGIQASHVRLELRDHGPGLPKDPEVLFKPFFTTKSQGTGLGLPIARALMRAHGGRLWAENAEHRGARFILEWPGALGPRRGKSA